MNFQAPIPPPPGMFMPPPPPFFPFPPFGQAFPMGKLPASSSFSNCKLV